MGQIEDLIRDLPPDLRQEVEDFVEFLLTKQAQKSRSRPTFRWAGALKDLRTEFTSVELQHRIAEWRIGPP